ncbi:MAG: hypothetical protein LIO86_10110 [Lachnospiraceae bacterium]|nr:hypothetical protein [Lachnospiraceae bacterium]
MEKAYRDEKIDYSNYREGKKKVQIKRDCLELNYGVQYRRWKGVHCDDRQLFCNVYEMLAEALDAMEGVDNTLIWIGFNTQYEKEMKILADIQERFSH